MSLQRNTRTARALAKLDGIDEMTERELLRILSGICETSGQIRNLRNYLTRTGSIEVRVRFTDKGRDAVSRLKGEPT